MSLILSYTLGWMVASDRSGKETEVEKFNDICVLGAIVVASDAAAHNYILRFVHRRRLGQWPSTKNTALAPPDTACVCSRPTNRISGVALFQLRLLSCKYRNLSIATERRM